ncbi:hypothetical protein AAMO2058_000616700 [Amorphochlora amoebiformis]
MESFTILNNLNLTLPDGTTFPFNISTSLYPEWGFGALSGVDLYVGIEVMHALHSLNATDTPAITGDYSGFSWPQTYSPVHELHMDINWVSNNTCVQSTILFDQITCPTGYVKISNAEFSSSCGTLSCPTGYECMCSPCRAADSLEITIASTTCSRLESCVSAVQNSQVSVTVVDHTGSTAGNITYKMHHPEIAYVLDSGISSQNGSEYTFAITPSYRGDLALEILNNDAHIPGSPTILRMTEMMCSDGSTATVSGECGANKKSYDYTVYFYAVLGLLPFMALGFYYVIKRKGDEWADMVGNMLSETTKIGLDLLIHILDLSTDVASYFIVLSDPSLTDLVIPYTMFLIIGGFCSMTHIALCTYEIYSILYKDESVYAIAEHLDEKDLNDKNGKVIVLGDAKEIRLSDKKKLQFLLKKSHLGLRVALVGIFTCGLEDVPFIAMNAIIIMRTSRVELVVLTSLLVNCFILGSITSLYNELVVSIDTTKRLTAAIVQSMEKKAQRMKDDIASARAASHYRRNSKNPDLLSARGPKSIISPGINSIVETPVASSLPSPQVGNRSLGSPRMETRASCRNGGANIQLYIGDTRSSRRSSQEKVEIPSPKESPNPKRPSLTIPSPNPSRTGDNRASNEGFQLRVSGHSARGKLRNLEKKDMETSNKSASCQKVVVNSTIDQTSPPDCSGEFKMHIRPGHSSRRSRKRNSLEGSSMGQM